MNHKTKQQIYSLVLAATVVAAPAATWAAVRPNDESITSWVKLALREDQRVTEPEVHTTTVDGIVTLTGSVPDMAARKYAVLEAKKINGVRGVVDELTVMPDFRYDMDISNDVRQRLIDSSAIESQGLSVYVKDGVVTLEGKVKSWSEHQQADLLASEVRGVKEVINKLKVAYTTQRTDSEIANDVNAALHRDVYLTGLPVSVSVHNGVVKLTGTVGNLQEKDRAAEDTRWVSNVIDVDNQLTVEWLEDQGVRKMTPLPSESELQSSVLAELNEDLRLDPYDITVEASEGHITLYGTVPTYHQKMIAAKDAGDVVGVAWVTNLLTVHVVHRSDDAIQRDIGSKIDSDYLIDPQSVKFHVKDGKVTLTGMVDTMYERQHATDLVAGISGVRDLTNDISLNYAPKFSNTSLQERIEDRLANNDETRWSADAIHVKVENGKATLTGKVNHWYERNAAQWVAFYTDGIWSVDNMIQVGDAPYDWTAWYISTPNLTHAYAQKAAALASLYMEP